VPDKYVLIGSPHTSNWDFPIALLLLRVLGIEGHWIAKHTVFRWPVGWLMRWLGGLPVDRTSSHNFVDQIVQLFEERERLVITIAPEGTRKRTAHWKTGFYYIALGAGIPIVLGYLDYPNKRGGLGPTIQPSGDLEADLDRMKEFYADKTGRHPGKMGEIAIASSQKNDRT
jgi:1-acyl-sn-glycerol-3-phosphate acyltransferase